MADTFKNCRTIGFPPPKGTFKCMHKLREKIGVPPQNDNPASLY